jgi:hypothetical protein
MCHTWLSKSHTLIIKFIKLGVYKVKDLWYTEKNMGFSAKKKIYATYLILAICVDLGNVTCYLLSPCIGFPSL